MSTRQAEYVAVSEAYKEVVWLTRLHRDLGIILEVRVLHCGDSESAIQVAQNPKFMQRESMLM